MGIYIKHLEVLVDYATEKLKKYREKRNKNDKINKSDISVKKTKKKKATKKDTFVCPKNKRTKPKGKTCQKCAFFVDQNKVFCMYKKR